MESLDLKKITSGEYEAFQEMLDKICEEMFDLSAEQLYKFDNLDKNAGTKNHKKRVIDVTPFEKGLNTVLSQQDVNRKTYPNLDYNHLDYAELLESGISLITRASILKEDAEELVLRGVNDILERWKIYKENLQLKFDYEQGFETKRITAKEKLIESLTAIVDQRKKRSNKRLKIDYLLTEARISNLKHEIEIDEQRLSSLVTQLTIQDQWNTALLARFFIPGSANNYLEKLSIYRRMFNDNLVEGNKRLKIALEGLTDVYPEAHVGARSFPKFQLFPTPNYNQEIGYTEALLNWSRDTLFVLDQIKSKEQQQKYVFSLREKVGGKKFQAYLHAFFRGSVQNIDFTETDFDSARNPRLLKMNIKFLSNHITPDSREKLLEHINIYSIVCQPPNGQRFYFGDVKNDSNIVTSNMIPSFMKNTNPIGKWSFQSSNGNPFVGPGGSLIKKATPYDIWIEFIVSSDGTNYRA